MSLDGKKKLPTLRPSRDIKLTGMNKPKKALFTPNITNNRKRPAPSEQPENTSVVTLNKKISNKDSTVLHNNSNPNSLKKFNSSKQHMPDARREMEINKRRNNVFVTTSIFSCGLAEKAVSMRKSEAVVDTKVDMVLERNVTTNSEMATVEGEEDNPEEMMDPYDDSLPRSLPLDRSLEVSSSEKQAQSRDEMLSLWNSKPRMLTPPWPGLDPVPISKGYAEVDRSLPSDLFSSTDDKAQILFLQLPDKFPVKRPRRPDETEMQYIASHKHGKAELANLKQISQGSIGKIQLHQSGRVSMKIGDATFQFLNATPAAFLQELVVIDHPPGSAQGHLTHLGYLSGRMVCAPDLEALASDSPP